MAIIGKFIDNKYVIREEIVEVNIFTDSAGYRQPNGTYDSNVAYFIYYEDKLVGYNRVEYTNKTNNFGELKAIELALRHVKNNLNLAVDKVNIYSDSLLSINYLTAYLPTWLKNVRNGIMYSSKNEPVKNQDVLWDILEMEEYFKSNNIKLKLYFVRSHSSASQINKYHQLFCKDNKVAITVDEYKLIRERNAICDECVKMK